MGINKETEAVWIDDGVWDMNGVLVAWIDATDQVPQGKNYEAYKLVYKEPVDSNRSLIYKAVGGLAKILFKINNDEGTARKAGFNVSPEPIPKPAIDGFPDGKTVDGITKADSSPEKKIIIREDLQGSSPYKDKVWGGSDADSKTVAQLKSKIQDLRMRLEAEEGKTEELSEEMEREDNDGRSNRNRDLFPEEQGVNEGEYYG